MAAKKPPPFAKKGTCPKCKKAMKDCTCKKGATKKPAPRR